MQCQFWLSSLWLTYYSIWYITIYDTNIYNNEIYNKWKVTPLTGSSLSTSLSPSTSLICTSLQKCTNHYICLYISWRKKNKSSQKYTEIDVLAFLCLESFPLSTLSNLMYHSSIKKLSLFLFLNGLLFQSVCFKHLSI